MGRYKESRAKLTYQQSETINFYFENGFNQAAAMRSAGYAKGSIHVSQTLFNKAHIKKEIERRKAIRAKEYEVTQDWVTEQFMKRALAGLTLAKFKVVQPDGSLGWDFRGATQEELALVTELAVTFEKSGRGKNAIDVTKFQVKEPDAHAALIALGRHISFFNDKLEVTGGSLAERIKKARKQGYQPAKDGPKSEDAPTVH